MNLNELIDGVQYHIARSFPGLYKSLDGTGLTDTTGTTGHFDSTANLYINQLVEVDREVMRVTATSGTVQRGVHGTTATTHAASARVSCDPVLFREAIARSIRSTVRGLYPHGIYRMRRGTFTMDSTASTTTLSTDVPSVDSVVEVRANGSPVGEWRAYFDATGDGSAAQALTLRASHLAGVSCEYWFKSPFIGLSSANWSDSTGTGDDTTMDMPDYFYDYLIYAGYVKALESLEGERLRRSDLEEKHMNVALEEIRTVKESAEKRSLYELEQIKERFPEPRLIQAPMYKEERRPQPSEPT